MATRDLSPLLNQRFERTITLECREADAETRTVPASLSSETPIDRWFGQEVLVHQSDAIDLSRAADGLPMLWNHNSDLSIGVVDDVKLVKNKLRGLLRFSNNAKAQEVFNDVREGFLRNVSIGYQINKWEEQANSDLVRIISWSLLEASVVTVPADGTVGINRSYNGAKTMTDEIKPVTDPTTDPAPVID
jgi:HK97 family phage prohead protease